MRKSFYLLLIILLCSCSKELDVPKAFEPETVNGFEINWRNAVTPEQQQVVRDIVSNMVKVGGGTFVMGATPEQTEFARKNEYPLCYVKLSDYYMCRYEITDEQYIAIVSDHREYTSSMSFTWDHWYTFIKNINAISGLNFDFPTEAQWEYAARGGKESKGYVYPGSNVLSEVWTDSETEGSQTPNELGLYNMADLKSEWCKDRYYDYNSERFLIDPCAMEGKYRVVRGGNYHCGGNAGSKYLTSVSNNGFGWFRSPASVMEPYDYRYCRSTARTYYFVQSESENGAGSSKYVGCRLVINSL